MKVGDSILTEQTITKEKKCVHVSLSAYQNAHIKII